MGSAVRAGGVTVVLNPISGRGRRGEPIERRVAWIEGWFRQRGILPDVHVTEARGHATQLTAGACAGGADLVVAWGGDGTVNEVASALLGTQTALGVIPGGSGNGLARELGVPRDPGFALEVAVSGADHRIDVGQFDGRPFVNVAGIGLDATIAARFAELGARRRGLRRYLEIATLEVTRYQPQEVRVTVDGEETCLRPMILAFANARQYGNGAVIAPRAQIDDGRLEMVVVEPRSLWQIARSLPKLFRGELGDADGVHASPVVAATIAASQPLRFHVDGEPWTAGEVATVGILHQALAVRVPRGASVVRSTS